MLILGFLSATKKFGITSCFKYPLHIFVYGVQAFRSLDINLFKWIITSSSGVNCIIFLVFWGSSSYLPRRVHQAFKIMRQRCVKLNTWLLLVTSSDSIANTPWRPAVRFRVRRVRSSSQLLRPAKPISPQFSSFLECLHFTHRSR